MDRCSCSDCPFVLSCPSWARSYSDPTAIGCGHPDEHVREPLGPDLPQRGGEWDGGSLPEWLRRWPGSSLLREP